MDAEKAKAMSRAYSMTAVPVAQTQEGIRRLLQAHAVRGVQFREDWATDTIGFEFVKMKQVRQGQERLEFPIVVKMLLPLWSNPADRLRASQPVRDQRSRQVWRALYWYLKSQLEAVAFGLRTLEDVFMADIVMQDGRTIGDHVRGGLAEGRLALPEKVEA